MSNFLASDLSSLSLFESSMHATTNGYYPNDYAAYPHGGMNNSTTGTGKKPYYQSNYAKKPYYAGNNYNTNYTNYGPVSRNGATEATATATLTNGSTAAPTTTTPHRASALNNELIDAKYNARDFMYNGEAEGKADSRFFIIKSYSKEDVMHAIHHNVWCSTETGNARLDQAFGQKHTNPHVSVYLFFSVNGSGQFCGMAEMVSPVDFSAKCPIWTQDKWKGKFELKWVYVKDIPNGKFKHVLLPNNEHKPVTNSRDCQEVLFAQAVEVLNVFRTFPHRTTILDDVDLAQFDGKSQPSSSSATSTTGPAENGYNQREGDYKPARPYSYRQQKLQQHNTLLQQASTVTSGSQSSKLLNGLYDAATTNGYPVKKILTKIDNKLAAGKKNPGSSTVPAEDNATAAADASEQNEASASTTDTVATAMVAATSD
jgi:hypothetical protein